jgi:FAD/FMN-containing dehydrogenase
MTMPTSAATGAIVNDVHSRLNRTAVDAVVPVDSVESITATLERARSAGRPVAVAGGRHAMGGQQFRSGGVVLDTRPLSRVLSLDTERGVVEVEAGIQWPALIDALAATPWAIRQKQTGADDFSIGGAVSANVHGRGLTFPPFVGDVERLVVVRPDGAVVICSRGENPDLFRLVCGGYGLFGVVYSATLRLVPRRKVERIVRMAHAEELAELFAERITQGYVYGDFQFEIDPGSPGFLCHGVFSCYRAVPDETPLLGEAKLSGDDWHALLHLAHTDKERAFELYRAHYLATSRQLYWSDRHQLAAYVPDYHWPGSSEMISELYVPRALLAGFLADAARELRLLGGDVVYGTVRLIDRDDETALAWAREPWACVVLNLHVEHTAPGLAHAATCFRRLIDLALERGGSFYLTYHRWATRRQLLAAYPQLPEVLAEKIRRDPSEVLQSDWYRWLRSTVVLEDAA